MPLVCFIIGGICLVQQANYRFSSEQELMPGLTIASIDFTVFNVTETHLSAEWNLLIRALEHYAGNDNIYLPEGIQVSSYYKNVTFTTTSTQRLLSILTYSFTFSFNSIFVFRVVFNTLRLNHLHDQRLAFQTALSGFSSYL